MKFDGDRKGHPISGQDEIKTESELKPGQIIWNALIEFKLKIIMLVSQRGKDLIVNTSLETQMLTMMTLK
jgi:hypothetical protein